MPPHPVGRHGGFQPADSAARTSSSDDREDEREDEREGDVIFFIMVE
jgi:hypothetical protein